jgi:hypothetical protein
MKQKILQALKTKYSSKGLSEKALDGVASILEKTVTEESQIDAAISEASVVNLINVYQSESDALRNLKATAEKALADYKAAHPEQRQEEVPKADDEHSKALRELQAQIAELKKDREAEVAKAKRDQMLAGVRRSLKEGNRNVDALLDIVLSNPVIADDDTEATVAERVGKDYDSYYAKLYGNGAVPSFGSAFGQQGGSAKPDFSGVVKRLQEEGRLPQKTDK